MQVNETFAAIATAMSPGSISVIRISGSKAFSVIQSIFKPKNEKRFQKLENYTIHYGHILNNDLTVIDEVIVLLMKGPKSFTGEDTVEIDCHGGALVTKKILERVLEAGARPAEPGEFTKHAFLNGRIDLSEAEAVMDIISSKNEYALSSSVKQLQGQVSNKINKMRDQILDAIAYIEAALDDPEHISMDGYTLQLKKDLITIYDEIDNLIKKADDGIILKEGIKTVILGKPNAGKSSLMNLLIGKERSIVTEIAGTTRDTLQEQIQIGGIGFNILDTAGIHETEDVVEKIGVERSIAEAKQADLILFVVDSAKPIDEDDKKILKYIEDKKVLIIYNKTDLTSVVSMDEIRSLCKNANIIAMSAKRKEGLDLLKETLVSMFLSKELQMNDEVIITNVRHKNALILANKSIKEVLSSIDDEMSEDFLTIDLMDAYEALGTITGQTIQDDVADRIFEKFCMGK